MEKRIKQMMGIGRTKPAILLSILLAVSALPESVDACDLSIPMPVKRPGGGLRVVGVVLGYGAIGSAVKGVSDGATLRVRVDHVISGPSASDPSRALIVADETQGGFVAGIPRQTRRITTGELDFSANSEVSGRLLEFEFDRALLALADSPAAERFARLMNLAGYPGRMLASSYRDEELAFFSELVAESGIRGQPATQLLERRGQVVRN
jgi:hypothetical protein